MILEEQHRHQDDIAARDVGAGGIELLRRFLPVGSGVKANRHPGIFAREPRLRALHRARQMIVERDDDDADGSGGASGHNAPLRHRGCRA